MDRKSIKKLKKDKKMRERTIQEIFFPNGCLTPEKPKHKPTNPIKKKLWKI